MMSKLNLMESTLHLKARLEKRAFNFSRMEHLMSGWISFVAGVKLDKSLKSF